MSEPDPTRLLLIEDNPDDVRLISELLLDPPGSHWHLTQRARLSEALIRIELEPCDLALLNLNLPDNEGLETLRRSLAHAPDLSVVVLTGMTDEVLGEQALAIGAQDYLPKDEVLPAVLHRALRHALERAGLKRRLDAAQERDRQARERAMAIVGGPSMRLNNWQQ